MKRFGWIFATVAITMATTTAHACMKGGETVEATGGSSIGSARDAAGRPQRPYIVTLSAPACLTASDPEDSVKGTRTIHIFSTDEKVHAAIAGLVGKTVLVRGTPFPAHTGHHHAPIVMDITEISAQ